MDFGKIMARARAILTTPKTEWPVIAAEQATVQGLYTSYILVLAGAVAGNFLLQIYGAVRAGSKYRPSLDLRHPGFKMFIKLAVPIMLALSLSFTDDWIIRWFGSYLQPAAITWLSYSKTLMRVPLGVVGQAVGVASFWWP